MNVPSTFVLLALFVVAMGRAMVGSAHGAIHVYYAQRFRGLARALSMVGVLVSVAGMAWAAWVGWEIVRGMPLGLAMLWQLGLRLGVAFVVEAAVGAALSGGALYAHRASGERRR